jgi:recombinational DNA repair protein (RecF pathway)
MGQGGEGGGVRVERCSLCRRTDWVVAVYDADGVRLCATCYREGIRREPAQEKKTSKKARGQRG